MASKIYRFLRELLDVDTTGVADGDALVYNSATEKWEPSAAAGGGAPTDVNYLVGTASGDLSNEIVVGTAPGGELGGTWASPTVDATHSGSSHASVQAAAEATAAAALSSHAADTTGIHGIADTSALETSAGAQSKVDAHVNDATDAHDASAISSVPAGSLAATDVQAALNELDSEKAAASHAHAGEDITSGTVADARIASTIARDSEVTAAISASEAGQVRDGDAAGGVLSGTYPNPGFAADMATQAELDAHVSDSSAAHAASAISADSTTLVGVGTDVQAVLEELDNGIADHLADTSAAHAASAISVADSGGYFTGTDVESALQELGAGGGGAWTPLDIPMLSAWFDPSDASTITDAGSGAVSQLNDKSGWGFHLTQGTNDNRPITGTRTINGLNTLDFDGTNDILSRATTALSVYAIYAVVEPDVVSGDRCIFGEGGGAQPVLFMSGATPKFFGPAGTVSGGANASAGTPLLIRAVSFNARSFVRSGGVEGTAGAAGATNAIATLRMGSDGSGFFNGKIGEIISLASPPSGDLDATIREYLADKWGVTA